MSKYELDDLDRQILKLISENARIPFLEVARACKVSGAAIHQRIQKLTGVGVIKGSQYVLDPEMVGFHTCAFWAIFLRYTACQTSFSGSPFWALTPVRPWNMSSLTAQLTLHCCWPGRCQRCWQFAICGACPAPCKARKFVCWPG